MGQYYLGATMTPEDTKLNGRFVKYEWLNNILIKAGYPAKLRGLVIAQVLHETNDFKSRLANNSINNITGIKYTKNSPYQSGSSNGYAVYKTYEDWAKDLLRILNFSPGKPVLAIDTADYARRLKLNKYYEDSQANYLKQLNFWASENNKAINWANKKGAAYKSGAAPGTLNTSGWTMRDSQALAAQEHQTILEKIIAEYKKSNGIPQGESEFNWNLTTWSTQRKVIGAAAAIGGFILLNNLLRR